MTPNQIKCLCYVPSFKPKSCFLPRPGLPGTAPGSVLPLPIMPGPPAPSSLWGAQTDERALALNAKTRQTLIINADRSPTLSSEWKDCESFSGKASGKSDAGHQRTFSAQTRVHSQLIGVCLSTLILDEGDSGVICSWLQIIRVSFDTFFSPPFFLNCSEIFHRRGDQNQCLPTAWQPPTVLFVCSLF